MKREFLKLKGALDNGIDLRGLCWIQMFNLNVSQNDNIRSWIDQCQFQTMPIPNLDINQWVKKSSGINQT
jgi:hypothetical protein